MSKISLSERLFQVIEVAKPQLSGLSEDVVSAKPDPEKWSKKEILGHLIDSATNNHRRFMIAQFRNDLVFSGYAQDQWVEYQDYANAQWSELVEMWSLYNRHIARLVANIPRGILFRQFTEHNYHLIAYATIPQGEPASLAYLIEDYIGHAQHHLRQILEDR